MRPPAYRPGPGDVRDDRWKRLRRLRWDPELAREITYWVRRRFELPPVDVLLVERRLKTKLGDYRYDPRTGRSTIRILGRPSMVTLLHELAHHLARVKYRAWRHGDRFKRSERKILDLLVPGEK